MDVADPLTVGDRVKVKLLLLPSYTGVLAFGEVVGVEADPEAQSDYPYHVRINFTLIRSVDQDALRITSYNVCYTKLLRGIRR